MRACRQAKPPRDEDRDLEARPTTPAGAPYHATGRLPWWMVEGQGSEQVCAPGVAPGATLKPRLSEGRPPRGVVFSRLQPFGRRHTRTCSPPRWARANARVCLPQSAHLMNSGSALIDSALALGWWMALRGHAERCEPSRANFQATLPRRVRNSLLRRDARLSILVWCPQAPVNEKWPHNAAVQALVAEVLRAWREAERVANEREPGTSDHVAAMIAVERLRDVYADLMSAQAGETDATADRSILDTVRLSTATDGGS